MQAKTLGLLGSAATFGAYMIGSSRALSYDSAVTMHYFVGGSVADAYLYTISWNNHVGFSVIASLVADVAGTGESVMRAIPAVSVAAAVGLLMWRIALRWGSMPAAAGGLLLATHPLVVDPGREVRGYGLATLAIVLMGIAVMDRDDPLLFGIAGFVGIASHLYAGVIFAALLVLVVVERRFDRRWRISMLAVALGTAVAYAGILTPVPPHERRSFQPSFPADLGHAVLGGNRWAVIALAPFVAALAVTLWRSRQYVVPVVVIGLAILGSWLAASTNLSPRFFYWTVPPLALLAAATVKAVPRAAVFVLVGSLAAVAPLLSTWTSDAAPTRELARRMGSGTCVAPVWSNEALLWYADVADNPPACSSLAVYYVPMLEPEYAVLREDWPALCTMVPGISGQRGEILALDPSECPRQDLSDR